MRRARGTGCLFGLLEYMIVGSILMSINLFMTILFGLIRNLPTILRAARQALRESLIWAYKLDRPILAAIQPLLYQLFKINLAGPLLRTITTALFSLLVLLGFDLVLRWRVMVFFVVLAILHGVIVGLLWDELEQTDHLRTGEKIG